MAHAADAGIKKMEIYLDNAATTKCDEEVVRLMQTVFLDDYGNPSSAHRKGFRAEQLVKEAAEEIAKTLYCKKSEIVFTSGGTESDNLALFGAAHALKRSGNRILVSAFEHAAVYESARALEKDGFDVVFLPVDTSGLIRTDALEEALTEDVILVSVMAVNNETGSIAPLAEIGRIVKERCPGALFHTDAVQAYGKVPLDVKAAKIDLLSVSAHKLNGPKGAGFLYVREGVRLEPIIFGGGQQKDLRSGTENVPGIAGLGLAAKLSFARMEETRERQYALRREFCDEVTAKIPETVINCDTDDRTKIAPHIISLSVKGVRAEVLLHALEDKGVYVSGGSACATNHPAYSRTLQAIGVGEELLGSTVRISLSHETTKEELTETLRILEELIPQLRKYQAH